MKKKLLKQVINLLAETIVNDFGTNFEFDGLPEITESVAEELYNNLISNSDFKFENLMIKNSNISEPNVLDRIFIRDKSGYGKSSYKNYYFSNPLLISLTIFSDGVLLVKFFGSISNRKQTFDISEKFYFDINSFSVELIVKNTMSKLLFKLEEKI